MLKNYQVIWFWALTSLQWLTCTISKMPISLSTILVMSLPQMIIVLNSILIDPLCSFYKKFLSLIVNKSTNFLLNTFKNNLYSICNLNRRKSSKLSKFIKSLKKVYAQTVTSLKLFLSILTLLSEMKLKYVHRID